jgi:hypothetical protein
MMLVTRQAMNELNLVLLGLVALVFSVVLLWAPEIIQDKEVEIALDAAETVLGYFRFSRTFYGKKKLRDQGNGGSSKN